MIGVLGMYVVSMPYAEASIWLVLIVTYQRLSYLAFYRGVIILNDIEHHFNQLLRKIQLVLPIYKQNRCIKKVLFSCLSFQVF